MRLWRNKCYNLVQSHIWKTLSEEKQTFTSLHLSQCCIEGDTITQSFLKYGVRLHFVMNKDQPGAAFIWIFTLNKTFGRTTSAVQLKKQLPLAISIKISQFLQQKPFRTPQQTIPISFTFFPCHTLKDLFTKNGNMISVQCLHMNRN